MFKVLILINEIEQKADREQNLLVHCAFSDQLNRILYWIKQSHVKWHIRW
jgi:hypothetical protein